MENVLIIGANGKTGRIVVRKLKDHGDFQPIAMIRDKAQQKYFDELGVKTVLGDLEKDFSAAYKGIERVIFVAGSGSQTGKDKTVAVDQEGAKKSIDLAKDAGVKRYVMLSARGADEPDPNSPIDFYLAAKHIADEYLIKSGVPYAVVRAGGLTDNEETGKIKAAYHLGESGKISRADVAQTLITCLDRDFGTGLTFEIINGETPIKEAIENLRQV